MKKIIEIVAAAAVVVVEMVAGELVVGRMLVVGIGAGQMVVAGRRKVVEQNLVAVRKAVVVPFVVDRNHTKLKLKITQI